MKIVKDLLVRFLQWLKKFHTDDSQSYAALINADNVIQVDFRKSRRRLDSKTEEEILDEEPLHIELVIPAKVVRRMNEIRKLNGSPSHVETFRRAIVYYDTVLTLSHEEGAKIFVHCPGEEPEQLTIR